MISLRRLNGTEFVLNAELIEQVEKTPDTVITLVTGNNIVVRESVEDVIKRVVEYRAKVFTKGKLESVIPEIVNRESKL